MNCNVQATRVVEVRRWHSNYYAVSTNAIAKTRYKEDIPSTMAHGSARTHCSQCNASAQNGLAWTKLIEARTWSRLAKWNKKIRTSYQLDQNYLLHHNRCYWYNHSTCGQPTHPSTLNCCIQQTGIVCSGWTALFSCLIACRSWLCITIASFSLGLAYWSSGRV